MPLVPHAKNIGPKGTDTVQACLINSQVVGGCKAEIKVKEHDWTMTTEPTEACDDALKGIDGLLPLTSHFLKKHVNRPLWGDGPEGSP